MRGRLAARAIVALALGGCASSPPVLVDLPPATGHADPDRVAKVATAQLDPTIRSSAELVALRDRRQRPAPRAMALVVVELQQLERLFSVTPQSSPDRGSLIHRLARGYVELAGTAEREAQGRPSEADRLRRVRMAAHTAAAKYYVLLAEALPEWCATDPASLVWGPSSCAAEPYYHAALSFEAVGAGDEARKHYLLTIQNGGADTPIVAAAYIAFGEIFTAESAHDPSKWVLAQQSFEKAMTSSPESGLRGYALLRVGQVKGQLGDVPGARAAFDALRALASRQPRDRSAVAAARLVPSDS